MSFLPLQDGQHDENIYVGHFQFLDQSIAIQCDSPDFLRVFDTVYHHFIIPIQQRPDRVYALWTRDNSLQLGDRIVPCGDRRTLEAYGYVAILNDVFTRARSHLLFHAGVVSWQDQGVLLMGDTGLGKTTLTLSLVRRGFKFLSDDVAPIALDSTTVAPFPKRPGVRPWPAGQDRLISSWLTSATEGVAPTLIPVFGSGEKAFWDIEDLFPGSLGNSCLVRYLFVLSPSLQVTGAVGDQMYLMLHRVDEALTRDLAAIPGVQDIRHADGGFPGLELDIAPGAVVDLEVEAVCERQGALMLHVAKGPFEPPCFEGSPQFARLTPNQAALELIRKFRAGPRSAVIREGYKGNIANLFLDLVDLASHAACYRLQVGRLDETLDLICATVGAG